MMTELITNTLSVSLTVKNAAAALDFYTEALGAVEIFRLPDSTGAVAHAEFMVGNSKMSISGESSEWGAFAMPEGAIASSLLTVNVENCDDAFQRAIDSGAISLSEPKDQFWGVRSAIVLDHYGYRWNMNQVVEEISAEEMQKRAQAIAIAC